MKTKFDNYENTCNSLIKSGFTKQNFAFQVGGGEDENDDSILIKENIVLWWDYSADKWHAGTYSKCNYVNGINTDKGIIDINTYIK